MKARSHFSMVLIGASLIAATTAGALLTNSDRGEGRVCPMPPAGTSAATAAPHVWTIPHAVSPSSSPVLISVQSSRMFGYDSFVERSLRPFGPLHDLVWPRRLPIFT